MKPLSTALCSVALMFAVPTVLRAQAHSAPPTPPPPHAPGGVPHAANPDRPGGPPAAEAEMLDRAREIEQKLAETKIQMMRDNLDMQRAQLDRFSRDQKAGLVGSSELERARSEVRRAEAELQRAQLEAEMARVRTQSAEFAQKHRPELARVQMFQDYIGMVDNYSRFARDPSAAGIAAVVTAAEILRPRGNEAAIDYFRDVLPKTREPAVQRAIRLQLVELYRATNQPESALEQLQALITAPPRDGEQANRDREVQRDWPEGRERRDNPERREAAEGRRDREEPRREGRPDAPPPPAPAPAPNRER